MEEGCDEKDVPHLHKQVELPRVSPLHGEYHMANTTFITTQVRGGSVEEAHLADNLKAQRHQARSGGRRKEISSSLGGGRGRLALTLQ